MLISGIAFFYLTFFSITNSCGRNPVKYRSWSYRRGCAFQVILYRAKFIIYRNNVFRLYGISTSLSGQVFTNSTKFLSGGQLRRVLEWKYAASWAVSFIILTCLSRREHIIIDDFAALLWAFFRSFVLLRLEVSLYNPSQKSVRQCVSGEHPSCINKSIMWGVFWELQNFPDW